MAAINLEIEFDVTDAKAGVEKVNKMLEKTHQNWLKRSRKICKSFSDMVKISKSGFADVCSEVSKVEKEVHSLEQQLDAFGKTVPAAFDKVITMPKEIPLPLKSWKNQLKEWGDSIIGMFSGIWSSIQGTYAQLKGGFSNISTAWGGGKASEEIGGTAAGGLKSALPFVGQFIGAITQIPKAIKEVWNSLKSFAKGIAKLFGWMSEEEKVQADVLRDLGVAVSEDLAKKIADASKEIGDRFTAVTLHLGDIMRETEITADNFDDFASRARDVFSLLETGMISSAQATETLNDVFGQLAEKSDELGITFNKNMIELIQLSHQFGLEVESISQYVDEKLGIAISGLTTATQNLGEVGQAEFNRLARAAAATFNAMIQNGADVGTAIDQLKEIIQNLAKAQEENGLKGSAAFNKLKRYANLVETNKQVIESVKGMEDVYTSLAQVGAMNQKLFNDWQQETLSGYNKLIEGGFRQNEALAMMAPTLQALKEAHETMGFKIDDNTQALIEQAEAAGLLKPDPMERMTEAVEDMTKAVYELIDHIAGHSPPGGSLIEAFDTAVGYARSFKGEIDAAFATSPVESLIDSIGEIPRNIGININYNYEKFKGLNGGGGGNYGGGKYYMAQHGGVFTRPTNVIVGENPKKNPEFIFNNPQMEKLLDSIAKPARDLRASEVSDKKTVININIAGENVGRVLLPLLKQASRDGKVKLDPRVIED